MRTEKWFWTENVIICHEDSTSYLNRRFGFSILQQLSEGKLSKVNVIDIRSSDDDDLKADVETTIEEIEVTLPRTPKRVRHRSTPGLYF
ncbi:hypothetical protein QVD17_20902 [Tagetes erecta]|uniref:Uncharacterized protein n=1 Tax=Tagetes erecta TaxID=13708 RepID=A0AAD8KMI9_TARER|nr:hypothetical protein QVD17_20902 [Tagetes erecta]